MLDALSQSSYGAMSALGRNREQESREKAEAIRQGKSVQSGSELERKTREVSEEFVSVFMNQVMKSMRATVHENPSMHGGNGEKFFQDLLDSEQSKSLSKGSGYGLTDLVYESLMAQHRLSRPEDLPKPADSIEDMPTEPVEGNDSAVVGSIA